ncbi:MAG: phage holin family protein [Chloroflexota bacterium]
MRNFIIRAIINAIAISVAAYFLPTITVTNDIFPLLIVGAIITLANALLKPILTLLTCPAVILTLGLFIFVINGFVLYIASEFAGGALIIDGFWPAFWGGIIMAIVNMILEGIFGIRDDEANGKSKAKRD